MFIRSGLSWSRFGGAHSLHVWLKFNDLFGRSFRDLNQKRFSTVYLLFPLGKDLFTWCAGERSRGKVYPSVRSWNVCGVNPPCRLNIFAPKSASQDMLWHQTTSQDNRVSLRFGRGAAGYSSYDPNLRLVAQRCNPYAPQI